MEEAMKGADVLISFSTPGPDVVKPEWMQVMAEKSIVFVCANPIPEIYPYASKEAGAYLVATVRGDFLNQVNNSLGFPGILKGAIIARSRKITDNMTIAAAHSLANFAEKNRKLSPEYIIPTMQETEVFPHESADVAMQAIKDGVARIEMNFFEEAYAIAKKDIEYSRNLTQNLIDTGYISLPPEKIIQTSLDFAVKSV